MRRKIDIILGCVLVALSWLFVGASLPFLFIPDMRPCIAASCVMLVFCPPGSALEWEWIFGRPTQGADRCRSAMLGLSIAHGLVLAFVSLVAPKTSRGLEASCLQKSLCRLQSLRGHGEGTPAARGPVTLRTRSPGL
jgi:hypothetical protein